MKAAAEQNTQAAQETFEIQDIRFILVIRVENIQNLILLHIDRELLPQILDLQKLLDQIYKIFSREAQLVQKNHFFVVLDAKKLAVGLPQLFDLVFGKFCHLRDSKNRGSVIFCPTLLKLLQIFPLKSFP